MSLTVKQQIRKANDAARLQWGAYNAEQTRSLLAMLEDASHRLKSALLKASDEGTISYLRLQYLNAAVEKEMTALYKYLNTYIAKGANEAVNAAIKGGISTLYPIMGDDAHVGSSYIGRDGLVYKFNPKLERLAASTWASLNTDALDYLVRLRPQGLTLSQEIWNVTWEGQKQLLRRIGSAIVTGEKVTTLAKSIEGILGVKNVDKTTKSILHPGKGVYIDVSANALRLARTELSRAYVEGQHRYFATKDWIVGITHRVGGGNPCEECQSLDGTFYPKGEFSDIPVHPNCECYEEPVLSEEFNE